MMKDDGVMVVVDGFNDGRYFGREIQQVPSGHKPILQVVHG